MSSQNLLIKTVLSILGLGFLLIASDSFAEVDVCSSLATQIQQKDDLINQKYIQLDPTSGGIRNNNRSLFLRGTNGKGVLLQHGFIASPFEVIPLAYKLNQEGYTVYAPLLYGYGSSTSVANRVGVPEWKQAFRESVNLFSQCFDKFTLVGFSLGGGLSASYAYQHPEHIKELVLLSPYFGVGIPQAKALIKIVDSVLDSDRIPFKYFPAAGDAKAIKLNTNYYNTDLPLTTAKNLVLFGDELQAIIAIRKEAGFPVLMQYSVDDQSIDKKLAVNWVNQHFAKAAINTLTTELDIPHQVLVPAVNAYQDVTMETLSYFVKHGHFNTSNRAE